MTERNVNPQLTRQIDLAARFRESDQRGRLFWKAKGNWRWKNWQPNEIARCVADGQLVQRFYSLDEIEDYIEGGATKPMTTVKPVRKRQG